MPHCPHCPDDVAEGHLRMVRRLAVQLSSSFRRHVEIDDLVDAGVQGLVSAMQAFDPALGVQFGLFARHRIRGAMIDTLRVRSEIRRATLEDAGQLIFFPASAGSDADKKAYEREFDDLIRDLPDREELLIRLYYREGYTMREIARKLHVGECRVSQLHRIALDKIRANHFPDPQPAPAVE